MRRNPVIVQLVLLVGLWVGLMVAGQAKMFRDPGTFWHTALGERILKSGQVERSEPFSFTFGGCPYEDNQWLAELAMGGLYRLGGWDALLVVTTAILAGLYASLGGRLIRSGLDPVLALLLVALALAASTHQFHVRPLVLTLVLSAWSFSLLSDVEQGRRPVTHLAWMVPVVAVWANLHGGVLAGLGMFGFCVAGWVALGWFWGRGPCQCPRDAVLMAVVLAGSMLAVLANPYGYHLPLNWWRILSLPLPDLLEEHAPLDLSSAYGLLIVLFGVLYAVVWAGVLPRTGRVTWLVPMLWFAFGCLRIRNAPLFAITAIIALAEMLPRSHWAVWLKRHGWLRSPWPSLGRPWSWLWPVLPVVMILPALALGAFAVSVPVLGCGWARFDARRWPVDLLPELRSIESAAGTRVYNDLLFGGYLIFHTPGIKVFIDDRAEVYGRFLMDYDAARCADPSRIEQWRARYGFRHALVESDSEADRYLARSSAWRLLKRCPAAALYVVRSGSEERGIPAAEARSGHE